MPAIGGVEDCRVFADAAIAVVMDGIVQLRREINVGTVSRRASPFAPGAIRTAPEVLGRVDAAASAGFGGEAVEGVVVVANVGDANFAIAQLV